MTKRMQIVSNIRSLLIHTLMTPEEYRNRSYNRGMCLQSRHQLVELEDLHNFKGIQ